MQTFTEYLDEAIKIRTGKGFVVKDKDKTHLELAAFGDSTLIKLTGADGKTVVFNAKRDDIEVLRRWLTQLNK